MASAAGFLIYLIALACVFSTSTCTSFKRTSAGFIINCAVDIEYCWGDVSTTCSNETLALSILTASCADDSGLYASTSLDLDKHVRNYNGELRCSTSGSYSDTCSNTTLSDGHVLNSFCYNEASELTESSLDLDCCVTNNGGSLSWACGVDYDDALVSRD